MAWSVTFAGATLVAHTTGVYDFAPGLPRRTWQFQKLPRALGEFAKDLGLEGCDHSLKVVLARVAQASVASAFSTMRALAQPVAGGSPPIGTLAVPDYGSYANCVCTGVQPGAQRPVAAGVSASGYGSGAYYDLEFTLTFRQLG